MVPAAPLLEPELVVELEPSPVGEVPLLVPLPPLVPVAGVVVGVAVAMSLPPPVPLVGVVVVPLPSLVDVGVVVVPLLVLLPELPPVLPEPELGVPLGVDPEPPCELSPLSEPLGAGLAVGGRVLCPPLGAWGGELLGAFSIGATTTEPPYELVGVGDGASGNR